MALILHLGDAEASFEEHPIEVARRALMDAALIEDEFLAPVLHRVALSLPSRGRLIQREEV